MASWLRLDAGLDNHPDLQDAGPWALVTYVTLLRVTKELAQGGSVPAKFCTGRHLARRSLFNPQEYASLFDEALDTLIEVGLVVSEEDGVRIPAWKRYQEDVSHAERQAAYRERKKGNVTVRDDSVTPVTVRDGSVPPVPTTGQDMTGHDKKQQQPPPTPSVAGEGAAAAAASPLSDFCPHEPTSGAEVDEPDPTPVTPTPVTPTSTTTPKPASPTAPSEPTPEPTPEPAVRPSRRPRPAAQAQPDAAAADLTAAATVVRLWNTGPAQAGCPACAPAAELAPETRDRLAELLRRHGEEGLRDAFDRVGRSSFLVRRAKIPTTLPRVANGLWEGLLSGAYDDGRAGPAAGRKRKGLFPELEALHFPDDETREYALNPMNGLSIESIRRLAGPQPQEEATP